MTVFAVVKVQQTSKALTPRRRNARLDVIAFTHLYAYDLHIWPLTLKTFSDMPTHLINICGKFYWNPSAKYTDNSFTRNRR